MLVSLLGGIFHMFPSINWVPPGCSRTSSDGKRGGGSYGSNTWYHRVIPLWLQGDFP